MKALLMASMSVLGLCLMSACAHVIALAPHAIQAATALHKHYTQPPPEEK